jgi:hypothetical protein
MNSDLNTRFTGLILLTVRLIMAMAFFPTPVEYDIGGKSEQFTLKKSGKRQGMLS